MKQFSNFFQRQKLAFLALVFLPVFAFSQNKKISGRVFLGDLKNPAVGAAIAEKGTSSGTITDLDGLFELTVSRPDAALEVSFVGFVTQEISAATGPFEVVLAENAEIVREVVVTALGIKKEKARLGYASQEVSGATLQKATEANVVQTLTGRVAGLSIENKSNLFENADITLRGQKTLVVIDGIPVKTDFWNISSDDIESVNVLKGTAAAALYGALGINGAIMITTKKGKADGQNGVEVRFNSSTQLHAGFIRIPELQNTYGMGWDGKYAFKDGRGGGTFDDYGYVFGPKLNQPDATTASGFVELPQYNSPIDPATGERVPLPWISRSQSNLKKFLRQEVLTTNNVSVSGKSDAGDYRLSLSHVYQRGQVPNTFLNAMTGTMAGGLNLSKRLRAEATLSFNRQDSPNYPSAGYGADNYFYNIMLWMGPDLDIDDLKQYWIEGQEGTLQRTFNYTWYNNPHYLAQEYLKSYQNNAVIGQANVQATLTDHLKLMVRTGISSQNISGDRRTPYSFIYYGTGASPQGNFYQGRADSFQVVTDALLTYNQSFGEDWEVTATAGAAHRFNSESWQYSQTQGLNIPNFYSLKNSIEPVFSDNALYEKEVVSAFGFADLGWRRTVYVGVTGRNDRTSALQKPYNSFFYPSATAAVVLSEAFRMPKWLPFLKIRGAWAKVSTDPEPYKTLPVYETGDRWDSKLSLYRPGSLVAADLQPNETVSKEYGIEAKFFRNRAGLDLAYFDYTDQKFIVAAPVSSASGFDSRLVNGGAKTRKGVELTLNFTPIKRTAFRWDIQTNLSTARSYRKSYFGGETIIDGVAIGDRADVYRGWAWQRSPDGKIITENGRPQYIDHVINLGYSDPNWIWGVSNSLGYKNLSFSFLFDGREGGKMYNGVEAKLFEGGMHPGSVGPLRDDSYAGNATFLLDGVEVTEGAAEWDQKGAITTDTRKFQPNATKVKYIDHLFDTYVNGIDESVLYDRTFAKLREVVVTWVVPPTRLKKMPFKEASVSVVGRNLALFSKVPFMDPDGSTSLELKEPTYRNVGVNLNLKF